MVLTQVQYGGTGGTAWGRLSGTIADVLQKLANMSINATRVVYYTDDNTDAVAVYCKQN